MPIYRFKCVKCASSFEKIVAMDTQETICTCGETAKKDYKGSMLFASTGLPNGHSALRVRGK